MKRTYFNFIRKGSFEMAGGVSLDLEDGENWEEKIADSNNWTEFLPIRIEYDNDDWEFVPQEDDNDSKDK